MNPHRISLLAVAIATLSAYDAALASPAAIRTAATVAVETADTSVREELVANARELLSRVTPEILLPEIEITLPALNLD